MSAFALIALAVLAQVHVPMATVASMERGRPIARIAAQPVFVVAALAAALGYGVMNLLMTATPLAMSFCNHPYAAAAFVIEWHVVGMYAPGFFTGGLIQRFGVLKVILAGTALVAAAIGIAIAGNRIAHFWAALVALGIGWNLMYTGGTTLLTETYTPQDKAKTQGLNDFIVFTVMGISSFSSGALVDAAGWERMNAVALPFVAVVACAALWLGARKRRAARGAPTTTPM